MEKLFVFHPHVHPVQIGADLVLLDVSGDRYICLADVADYGELARTRTHLRLHDGNGAADLVAADLGVMAEAPSFARRQLPAPPTRSALAETYARPKISDVGDGFAALFDVVYRYRQRSFAEIVAVATRERAHDPEPSPRLLAAVGRFQAWSPLAPVSGKCLLQSFMLLRHLRRHGHNAVWVFGVRTWPFHAHCWLQVGDMVLDDPAERIWAYTAIMAV